MKQVTQNLKSGATELLELPRPKVSSHGLLIQTRCSLISAGTERMLVDFGKANYLQKARQQPDKVKMVMDKIKTDGLMPTINSVRNKLAAPMPMGYSNVGTVLELGRDVTGFNVGDRVVSNANHAELVTAASNLAAKIPDSVSDDAASFTVVGAIALQGIRISEVTMGETVVVMGLGLIGLLTVQLLRAQGCQVIGMDFDLAKLLLAKKFGAEVVDLNKVTDPIAFTEQHTAGRGVDAVIITASTDSNEPMHQAANMCRKKGRITLVGVTGLELSRADFYEKELTFRVSCSYGPGRYDASYEDQGQDYPYAFVRWTAQRNFQAFLALLADQKIDVQPLITHRFALADAEKAYELVSNKQPSIGIVLEYAAQTKTSPENDLNHWQDTLVLQHSAPITGVPKVSFVGAGNYATQILAPAFAKQNIQFHAAVSRGGLSSAQLGKKFSFAKISTDAEAAINDAETDIVVVATQHNTHAKFVIEALNAHKNVFVEKPLCTTIEQLEQIEETVQRIQAQGESAKLMVGFNRRFAPQVQKIKSLLTAKPGPKSFIYTVNAGFIPQDHWTQDLKTGGGRLLGEACHFVDLLRYLAASPIVDATVRLMGDQSDVATITLNFQDGSLGTIHYYANGARSFAKERLEVFAGGGILQLDNFRKLNAYGWPGFKGMRSLSQNKGQQACVAAFVESVVEGTEAPILLTEILEVNRVCLQLTAKQGVAC